MDKTTTAYVAGAATVVAVLGAYIYKRNRRVIIPWSWEEVATLKEINIYPLKSGHRVELDRAEVTEMALRQSLDDVKGVRLTDRFLVVYTEKDHEFRTARTYPKMVLIDVTPHDGEHVAIDAPTMRTLYVKIPKKTPYNETIIKLHQQEEINGIDCGDEAALWFSRYLLEKDSGLRLAYNDMSKRRDISKVHKSMMQFYKNLTNFSTGLYSDLTSVMLVNQASVDDLNQKMDNSAVTVHQFRQNLLVDGADPFDEQNWEWVKIGDVVMRNVKECTRCIMTTIDPETGYRSKDREPLKTLEQYCQSTSPKKEPVMGIHLEVRKTGKLSVGDKVYISRAKK